MRIKAATILATLLTAPQGVAAGMAPDAQRVLEHMARATGSDAWGSVQALRTHGTFHLGGLEGPIDIVEDARTGRFRAALDLGVFKQINGFDGTTPWKADASGIVDPQESDEAVRQAVNEAYRARRGYLRAGAGGADVAYLRATAEGGRRFDVLRLTPDGGRPAELWVDRKTGLPDRWIEPDATTTTTITFSDYREVKGTKLPFRTRLSDGNPANDQVTIVERYEPSASLPPAALARPRSEIRDASVEGGATDVPVVLEAGHIVVPVSINGNEPLPFVLDSGASVNVLTPAAAQMLGIKGEGAIDAEGVGQGTTSVSFARAKQLTVGGAKLRDQQFAVLPLPALLEHRGGDKPIAGLLGYDTLRRFVSRIDYAGRTLRLSAVRPCPATRAANELPIVFSDRIPEVEAGLDGARGLWSVDTGSSSELTVFGAFAEANRLGHSGPRVNTVAAGGVGGTVEGMMARFTSFQLGPHRLAQPYGEIIRAKRGVFSSTTLAGNIGSNVLRHFVVTLDYECRTMTLERGADFGSEEPINRAGVSFTKKTGAGGLEVLHVREGSPAAQAGVTPGDGLVAVNGKSVSAYSYGGLKEALSRTPGMGITLRLERGDRIFDVAITLADPLPAGPSAAAR